jgi:hypothetical protein
MAVEPRCNPERRMIYEAWSEALLADGAPPGTRPAWSAGEPRLVTATEKDFQGALRVRPRSIR